MTTKPCTICQHREAEAINAQLRLRTSLRKIEALFHVTRPSLSRHSKHLPPAGIQPVRFETAPPLPETPEIVAATAELAALQTTNDDELLVVVRAKRGAANLARIAQKAETSNSLGIAIQAWSKHREYLELIARLTGEIDETAATTNIFTGDFFDSLIRKHATKTIDITPGGEDGR